MAKAVRNEPIAMSDSIPLNMRLNANTVSALLRLAFCVTTLSISACRGDPVEFISSSFSKNLREFEDPVLSLPIPGEIVPLQLDTSCASLPLSHDRHWKLQ